jgi:hypothetical protein
MHFDLDRSVNAIELCPRHDFRVIRIFHKHQPVPHIKAQYLLKKILIDYKGMLLTEKYIDMVYIKKYLKLFTNKHLISDEPNPFFELVTQTVNKKQETAIRCKFDQNRIIYRAEADTILEGLHIAMIGYSEKYFHMGTNSIEALIYADTVLENRVPDLKIQSKIFVQNALQEYGVVEALHLDE